MFGNSKQLRGLVIIFLLLLIVWQAGRAILSKSPTVDEPGYLCAAGYILKYHRWDHPHAICHPPLFFYLHGFPLLFLNIPDAAWQEKDINAVGQKIISLYPNDLVMRLSRAPMLLVSLLLGYFIYRWAKELHGANAGLLALLLYAFEPNVLAFSGLITPDILIAFTVFLSAYCFWRLLKKPGWARLLVTGFACGLTFLSRYNGLFLVPIFGLIALALAYYGQDQALIAWAQGYWHRAGRVRIWLSLFTLMFATALLVVWAGYGFETKRLIDPRKTSHPLLDLNVPAKLRPVVYAVGTKIPVPLPSFIRGTVIQFTASRTAWPLDSFLLGKYSSKGWWYYYFVAYLIKTPVPLLAGLFLGVWVWLRERKRRITEGIFLLTPALFFLLYFSFLSKIQLGVRYLLPVTLLLMVLFSRVAAPGLQRRPVLQTLGILASLWYIAGTLLISPHYLAYFNELVGGPNNGYKCLVDSNLDWGQDLKGLKRFMDERGIDRIKFSYFGTADPKYYGIEYDSLPASATSLAYAETDRSTMSNGPTGPVKGIIAISATELQGVYFKNKSQYAWLKAYQPIAKIGYSIFVYDIK